jgi:tRNA (guanine37-N1)-methyltransferase
LNRETAARGPLRFDLVTIFPEMYSGVCGCGMIGQALRKGIIDIGLHDLRQFAEDKHGSVDDMPYGGGGGMVYKPEPFFRAVEALEPGPDTPVILLDPQGERLTQQKVVELSGFTRLVLLCCRYEGVDERVREHLVTRSLSIGDYVISGGELASMILVEAVTRLLPGAAGCSESIIRDSFSDGLLDFSHYTRPAEFRGMEVPEVLLSGDHGRIAAWRAERAIENTRTRRPDLYRRWVERRRGEGNANETDDLPAGTAETAAGEPGVEHPD